VDFQVTPLSNSKNNKLPSKRLGRFNFEFGIKFVFIGALVIVFIGVLFFLLGRSSFSEGKVKLEIDGPSEIKGGNLVTYRVRYSNNSKVSLNQVKLVFSYPEDSILVKDGKAVGAENEIIDLERIGRGKSGEIEFSAYVVGDRGNIKEAKAVLSFEPSSIVSVIQKEVILPTTITSLPVSLTLVAPPTATDGQNITYILDYRNQSGLDIEDLRIIIETPDSFTPSRFSPQSSGDGIWEISNLRSDEGSRITIQGILKGNERESKNISATLQRKVSLSDAEGGEGIDVEADETDKANEIYIDFEKATASTTISSPFLSVTTAVNGSRSYTSSLNDSLRYTIDFSNNTNQDILGLSLSAKLDGSMFDLSTVKSEGFFDSRQNTIFWNAAAASDLGILEANQSGKVEFTVKLKGKFPEGIFSSQSSLVKVSMLLETPNVPAEIDLSRLSAEDELITRISTSAAFGQELFVSDSAWGSNGPFPPKVDEKTIFTVKWRLSNPANLISPAKVRAVLAPGVSWENRTRVNNGSSQPTFNSSTSEVTWDIGSLPGGTGGAFPEFEGYFQISIIPSINQAGDAADLVRDVVFEGVDTLTKQSITKSQPDLSSARADDRSGGRVEP